MPRICIITAMGQNREIGLHNKLPWSLPKDHEYFHRITEGRAFICGRKSAISENALMSSHKNVVLTSKNSLALKTDHPYEITDSFQKALKLLAKEAVVFATGGEAVYAEALKLAERLYITQIEGAFEADTFFPKIDKQRFQLVAEEKHPADAQHEVPFAFCVYRRK